MEAFSTDISPSVGTKNLQDVTGDHIDNLDKGHLLGYSDIIHQQDDGDRPHNISSHTTTRTEYIDLPNPRTEIVGDLYDFEGSKDLPGSTTQNFATAHANYSGHLFGLTGRWRLERGKPLLARILSGANQRSGGNDPTYNSGDFIDLQSVQLPVGSQVLRQWGGAPEMRLDYALNRTADHASVLTLGYSRPRLYSRESIGVLVPPLPGPTTDSLPASALDKYDGTTNLVYAQILTKAGRRTSIGIAAQQEQTNYTEIVGATLPAALQILGAFIAQHQQGTVVYFLPSALISYQASNKTTFRLSANRVSLDGLSSLWHQTTQP